MQAFFTALLRFAVVDECVVDGAVNDLRAHERMRMSSELREIFSDYTENTSGLERKPTGFLEVEKSARRKPITEMQMPSSFWCSRAINSSDEENCQLTKSRKLAAQLESRLRKQLARKGAVNCSKYANAPEHPGASLSSDRAILDQPA